MGKFNEIKTEILRRAKEADACTEQYSRACIGRCEDYQPECTIETNH